MNAKPAPSRAAAASSRRRHRMAPATRAAVIPLLLLLLSGGLLAAANARAAEGAFMVTAAKGAELFQDRQVRARLATGRLVFASLHPQYDDWLIVVHNDRRYDARASSFMQRNALRDMWLRRSSDAATEAADLARRIGFNESHTLALYAAATAVRFDSAVQYRYTVQLQQVVQLTPLAIVPQGNRPGPGPGGSQVVMQPVYRYVDKISTSKSKSLAKTWRAEAAACETATEQLYRKRRDAQARQAQADATLARLTERFDRFEASLKDDLIEPYITVRDGAVLFQDKVAVQQLPNDTVVIGEPDPDYPDWLRVLHLGSRYESRRQFFRSRSETVAQTAGRLAALEQRLRDLNGQTSILTERERMLADTRMDALVQAELSHVPLAVYPFPNNFPGCRLYPIPDCPSDAVQVVLRSRVRRLVRDWEDEIAQVRASLDALHRDVREVRSALATLAPRHDDVMTRFARVEKAVGAAATD